MWTFLGVCLSWLISNPIVRAVAKNALINLVQHGEALVPVAIAEIKSAATRDDLSGSGKLSLVVDKLTEQFPAIAKDVGRSAIIEITQSTYAAMVSPEVKEVPSP